MIKTKYDKYYEEGFVMEENKLNNDELKQVSGGKNSRVRETRGRFHLNQITDFFRDKDLYYATGTFKMNANVWLLGRYKGSRGNCLLVRAQNSSNSVYIPDGTLDEGWEEDDDD